MSPIFRFLFALLLGTTLLRAQPAEISEPHDSNTSTNETTNEVKNSAEDTEEPKPVSHHATNQSSHSGSAWRHHYGSHSRTVFGQNVLVASEETVRGLVLLGGAADIQGTIDGDLVVVGGNAAIHGTVQGNVVVVGGALTCSGTVEGDTTVVLGSAELENSAQLEHDAVFIGGPFNLAEGASIAHDRVIFPLGNVLPKVELLKSWLIHGPLMGRLLPFTLNWVWAVAGVFTGLYLLALLIFPGAVKSVYFALEERPVTSIISGLLAMVLLAPLVVLLAISVVGIAVIPFLKLALILAVFFGKAGVMCFMGRSFGRSAGASFLQAPIFAFFIGAALLLLAYAIPVFGIFAWGIATLFGLGGAIVALSRTFQREEASIPPAPVRVSTLHPAYALPASPSSQASGAPPSISGTTGFATDPLNPNDTLLLPRAGFWRRLVAAFLDLVLLAILIPFVHAFFVPVAVLYFVGMWTWRGTTIGCLVMGLKVVRTDGDPVTFVVALVRCLSSFFSAIVLFLGFFWIGWDRDKQGWHDKIAGTVVVKMPKGMALI